MSASGYQYSSATPKKQRDFEAAIELHTAVTRAILDKYRKKGKNVLPYLYLDLFSGPGVDPEGERGSPLVFLDTAASRQMPFRAEFYEIDSSNASTLVEEIKRRDASEHVKVFNAHHDLVLNKHFKPLQYQYGAVYVDPSNASIPFEVLDHLISIYPRLDFIINLACASYKRGVGHPDYEPLDEVLPKMKRYWKIREPIGKHQWSIMIGTNWDSYPDLNPAAWRFHDIRTEIGFNIYKQLVYTKRQLTAKSSQMTLWDAKENK